MPEYRRFISYFYEYIDGKKQRNTGFAKVELRSGVWRILFRLTVPVQPGPPVEVFGFMREEEKLTGLPMGTMRAGREMTEEWAYRADEPVWAGKYGIPDIAGLWIRSGDGRCFVTVWDDEPVDPARFVKYEEQAENAGSGRELSEQTEEIMEDSSAAEKQAGNVKDGRGLSKQVGGTEKESDAGGEQAEDIKSEQESAEQSEEAAEEPGAGGEQAEDAKSRWGQIEPSGKAAKESDAGGEQAENMKNGWEPSRQSEEAAEEPGAVGEQVEDMKSRRGLLSEQPENRESPGDADVKWQQTEIMSNPEADGSRAELEMADPADDRLWRDLYAKRAGFQPFSDQDISDCIRVVPGDIVVLQNAHWRTGKNNFLLHGYYNYRHLLIGRSSDGGYVLGVPGIMNPQEKYMAAIFGFPDFKYADNPEGEAPFGYWCRSLKKEISRR